MNTPWLISLQGPRRKLVHALLCEALAITIVALLMRALSQQGLDALLTSLIAVSWNMVFNTLFEAWERRQTHRHRTWQRRAAHALGFEIGLVIMTVPLIAWWLHMSWWHAFLSDLLLVVVFLVFTFCYNWLFDHVFGLPSSAQAVCR
jgi:uncharacterized membrane protein